MTMLHVGMTMYIASLVIYIWMLVMIRLQLASLQDLSLPIPAIILNITERPAAMYAVYLKDFEKQYGGEELERRFRIFKNSLKEISRMNRDSGAKFGLTKFSDTASEELMPSNYNRSLGICFPGIPEHEACGDGPFDSTINYHRDRPIPDKFDWRDKGYVGPVLDQKKCNGCWAFGTVGVMETQAAIINGEYGPMLSIQELIDCSKFTNGCNNGSVVLALRWFCNNQWGVVTEQEYPLKLITQQCRGDYHQRGLQIRQFWKLCEMNEMDILRLLYFHGPLIVVVNAGPWLGYIEGVIQESCIRRKYGPGKTFDHVVQIVGYDNSSDTDVPHYIVRNSWGEDFGVGGYVKLAIGKNVCGLADEVVLLDVYA